MNVHCYIQQFYVINMIFSRLQWHLNHSLWIYWLSLFLFFYYTLFCNSLFFFLLSTQDKLRHDGSSPLLSAFLACCFYCWLKTEVSSLWRRKLCLDGAITRCPLCLACETWMIVVAMARRVELNVHHTSKHVCGRLRKPLTVSVRLTRGIGKRCSVVLLINCRGECRRRRDLMEIF